LQEWEAGANSTSLQTTQLNFERFSTSDPDRLADGRLQVRTPTASDMRDPDWRLVRSDEIEIPDPGVDQGSSYPSDYTRLLLAVDLLAAGGTHSRRVTFPHPRMCQQGEVPSIIKSILMRTASPTPTASPKPQ
jgi:hypothetical protein